MIFTLNADIILKLGAAHDLITVYSMDRLLEANTILSVRSWDLVSVLQQHDYSTADSHEFPPRLGSLSEV